MKNNYLFILVLIVIISCKKTETPEITISSDKSHVEIKENIKFINTTKKGFHSRWDFGDGTISSELAPLKSYEKAGKYTVTYEASSLDEKIKKTATLQVVIDNPNKKFAGTYDAADTYIGYPSCLSGTREYVIHISTLNEDELIISNIADEFPTIKVKCKDNRINTFAGFGLGNYAEEINDKYGKVWHLDSFHGEWDGKILRLTAQIRNTLTGSALCTNHLTIVCTKQ